MIAQQRKYKSVWVQLILYLDGVSYVIDVEFSKKGLNELQPGDLMRYFYFKTFGVEELTDEEKQRPELRLSCIKFWKKALLSFMPNHLR